MNELKTAVAARDAHLAACTRWQDAWHDAWDEAPQNTQTSPKVCALFLEAERAFIALTAAVVSLHAATGSSWMPWSE